MSIAKLQQNLRHPETRVLKSYLFTDPKHTSKTNIVIEIDSMTYFQLNLWDHAFRNGILNHDCFGPKHIQTWNPGNNEASGARKHWSNFHLVSRGRLGIRKYRDKSSSV